MRLTIKIGFELATAAAALLGSLDAAASTLEKTMTVQGITVQYEVVLPNGYDPTKAYPAILAFGGGPQTLDIVERTVEHNFRAEAEKRGYIVIAPGAPDDELFFEGGDVIFPEFLRAIMHEYKIADGKFHVAGPSNGGIAAMHVAAMNPNYFLSVTAYPGYLWMPSEGKLLELKKMCVHLYVGENDPYRWHDEMKREAEFLRAHGGIATYSVEKGQPHRLATLADANAGRLFDGFDAARKDCNR
jgi:poly(3-hydroxybutyrate) depolymerase